MKKTIMTTLIAGIFLFSCQEQKVELSGAGATFPLPYYNMVFKDYQTSKGVEVSYGGIGSGGGIRSLKDGIVDFAGSDAFLSDKEMAEMPAVVHIPTCLGAVVLSYNLPELNSLNLTGEIVADIYLGKITRWNDARIQAINKQVTLPDKSITPVYRSDGSGTTFVFSDYMTKVSPAWAEALGRGKSISFQQGIAAKGNPGVAGTIGQTPGSIGYIGSEYAFALKIAMAKMQNIQGEFVEASSMSISAAAQGDIPQDTRCMITNSSAQGAYPISCFTWLVVYKDQAYSHRSIEQARATVDLLKYILSDQAQKKTTMVHYAPLSDDVKAKALKAIESITYDNKMLSQNKLNLIPKEGFATLL